MSIHFTMEKSIQNQVRSCHCASPEKFRPDGNFSLLHEIPGGDCHKFSIRRARKQVPYIVSEKYFAQIYTEQFGKSGARMSLTCRRFKLSAHSRILLSSATPDNENLRWWKVRIVFQSIIEQFHRVVAQSDFCLKMNVLWTFPQKQIPFLSSGESI